MLTITKAFLTKYPEVSMTNKNGKKRSGNETNSIPLHIVVKYDILTCLSS